MTVGKLVVALIAQTKPFMRGVALAQQRIRRFGHSITRVGFLIKAAMAIVAAGAVARFARSFTRAAATVEQEQVKLAAVLKATGYAAGLSIAQLNKYEEELEQIAASTETAVVDIQTLLLTFRRIKGDVFREATEAVLDMAIVMDTSARSAAIQLGKALNDPIIGLTALRRVGVSFSEAQIEQIKNFTRTGRIMQAQRLILKELQQEFGGAARAMGQTFGGRLDQLKIAISTLWETIGLPIIDSLTPLLERWTKKIYDLAEHARVIYAFVATLFNELRINIVGIGTAFRNTFATIKNTLENVADRIRQAFSAALAFVAEKLTFFVDHAIEGINLLIRALNRIPKVDIAQIELSSKDIVAGLVNAAASYEKDITERNKRYYAGMRERERSFQAFAAGLRENYAEMINKQWETLEDKAEETKAAIESAAAVTTGAIKRPAALERGTVAAYSAAVATPHYAGLERAMRDSLALDNERNQKLDAMPAEIGREVADQLAVATM